MKSLFRSVILVLFVTMTACEEEEECIGCNLNPGIKLKFEAGITGQVFDSLLSAAKGELVALADSLKTELSDEERNQISSAIAALRTDSSDYDNAVRLFRSGRIRINGIEAPGSSGFEQIQDSVVSELFVPVDMKNDVSTYYFSYHDRIDTLQLQYEREIRQSVDGVRMKLNGISVNREISTFDSVKVKCYKVDCSNDLTMVYIYF